MYSRRESESKIIFCFVWCKLPFEVFFKSLMHYRPILGQCIGITFLAIYILSFPCIWTLFKRIYSTKTPCEPINNKFIFSQIFTLSFRSCSNTSRPLSHGLALASFPPNNLFLSITTYTFVNRRSIFTFSLIFFTMRSESKHMIIFLILCLSNHFIYPSDIWHVSHDMLFSYPHAATFITDLIPSNR